MGRKWFVVGVAAVVSGCCWASVAEDYALPVRPVGVNGQEAWNRRSVWFMYAPTFAFTNRTDAASYAFEVTDAKGARHAFVAKSANAALSPVWTDLPVGWTKVVCEARDAAGKPLGVVGTREFGRQAPFREGAYPKPKKSAAEASRQIIRYVMDLPIVRANYLGRGPVPADMVTESNQIFIAYPAKMGAAMIEAMAGLAADEPKLRAEALAYAEGVRRKLLSVTEPEGRPLAGFPRTYEAHPGLKGYVAGNCQRLGDRIMTIYPGQVGQAYLSLYAVTNDAALLRAAVRIADRYLALQGEDGTWPLNCRRADGKANEANRLVPVGVMVFLENAYRLTKDVRYREAADRAFGYVERGPLTSWNWEGQFEDVPPTGKFHNLTKHGACDTALYLLRRFPGDARRLAQARELLRFSEDQFVCWELPLYADAALKKAHFGVWGEMKTWRCPAVLEQYNCYVPIDASSAKLVRTYLALYRAEGNPVDLAKARALGDAIVRETDDKGRLPTFWFDSWEMWPNCMIASARALSDLADRR